jgi:hypothetical protein
VLRLKRTTQREGSHSEQDIIAIIQVQDGRLDTGRVKNGNKKAAHKGSLFCAFKKLYIWYLYNTLE